MKVRRLVGDVRSPGLLSDEEIYPIFSVVTSPTLAAAAAAEYLVGEFAIQVDSEHGQLKLFAASRMKHYMTLADRLREGGAGELPFGDGEGIQIRPYAGGVFVAEKEALEEDTSLVQPDLYLGKDDFTEFDRTEDD